jgi:PAS domain S-box-containing protein
VNAAPALAQLKGDRRVLPETTVASSQEKIQDIADANTSVNHAPRRRSHGLGVYLVVLSLASAVPALAVGAGAVWYAVGAHREAFDDGLRVSARGLALAIDAEMNVHLTTLMALASSPLLDHGSANLDAFYAQARRAADAIHSPVMVIGLDLVQLMNTDRPLGDALPQTNAAEVVRSVLGTKRSMVSNLLGSVASDRRLVVVAVPVVRDDQALLALVTRLEPRRLATILAAQVAGLEQSFAVITDANHQVIARSEDHEHFIGFKSSPGWGEILGNGETAGTGSVHLVDGQEAISAHHRLERASGWRVGVSQAAAAYQASWQRPLIGLAFGAAIALLVAAATAIALGRSIMRPINALTRRAIDVTRHGGTLQGLPPFAVDEFEALRVSIAAAESALREGEDRFARAVEAAQVGTWNWDPVADVMNGSSIREQRLTGRPERSIFSLPDMLDTIHPEDRQVVRDAVRRVLERETDDYEAEFRAVWPDGTVRWLRSVGRAIADARGAVREVTGVTIDVTERIESDRRRDVLAREVDHRAKNNLAVVQSILRLMPTDEPKAFVAAVEGRVAALARAHSLLAEEGWAGADLHTVAERGLAPYFARRESTAVILLEGPLVPLAPAAVQPIIMVLHELATNALEHGALSEPDGRVAVTWRAGRRAGEDGLLRLCWTESGVVVATEAETCSSFGTRVIDATIWGQLGGRVERRWEFSGLVCEISVPLTRILVSTEAPESRERKVA